MGDMLVAAACAPDHMPAERLGPAVFDRRHHLPLGQADMPRIGPSPRRAMGAEDISQFQRWAGHIAPASVQTIRSQRLRSSATCEGGLRSCGAVNAGFEPVITDATSWPKIGFPTFAEFVSPKES
jgi:hypothetical protein